MNFDDYEKRYEALYAEFAGMVRQIFWTRRSPVRRVFLPRNLSSAVRKKRAT